MRRAVGCFGLLCGAVVVVLVGRYGYRTTDVEFDAWTVAFLFTVIATFGLAGHALAVRLWRYNKLAAIGIGIVAIVSLGLNLSNSLGAIAGRSDVATAERIEKNSKISRAKAELTRLTDLRGAMPAFVQADAAAVEAAQRAADAAARSRTAECGNGDPKQRGRFCRDREADERDANDRLAMATSGKAASGRAIDLEARAQRERDNLATLGDIVTVNIQGSAIAKLFRLPEAESGFLATAQQFGTAAVAELIILAYLVAWEILGHAPRMPALGCVTSPEPEAPIALPTLPKPRLVASADQPVGSVKRILTENLERAPGGMVEIAELAVRYRTVCAAEGKRSASQDDFVNEIDAFCAIGIKRRAVDGRVYLMDVQLAPRGGHVPGDIRPESGCL